LNVAYAQTDSSSGGIKDRGGISALTADVKDCNDKNKRKTIEDAK
jgi:hypothetical protein